ncbi:MAG: NAD-dependent epimerase/dehydratase family protein [Planctomycetia bacterium]|nr:NAD-dependent epimerase/dehydratase family protein [Planctomycetia bacterium]
MPRTILITGANGEIGHGLISALSEASPVRIVALDLHPPDAFVQTRCHRVVTGDISDIALLDNLAATYDFDAVYHLAALLSTKSERQPRLANKVNVDGTINLLEFTVSQARQQGRAIKFLYPSSIAVHGLPDLATKARAGKVCEDDWCEPTTMYGINKLYCERLGRYYETYYRQLDAAPTVGGIDFRCIRFPGLISALTVPTGGTSDYAPEMLHAAASGRSYACFVRPDTTIPFMAMPDAIEALSRLEAVPRERLSRKVYSIGSFAPSAAQIYDRVKQAFPMADVKFVPDLKRQGIVDSWPVDVDDSAARRDWGWEPVFDFDRAFDDYLIPAVNKRYRQPPGR